MCCGLTPTRTLNDGNAIPLLGLGVYQAADGGEAFRAVLAAFEAGYRHVDTAALYGNETDVGRAVRECGLPREDVFITTKLWNDDHGYESALRAFGESLELLGLEYVDLYLLHWPVTGKRLDSWRALEALQTEGRIKSIGVSNFTVRHLEELLAVAQVAPAVNQVEAHPFLVQSEIRAYCAGKGIAVEAYSPLTKGRRLNHPTLADVADRNSRTVAQVLVRWALQRDMIVLPKSSRPERIRENGDVFSFELPADHMQVLDQLDAELHTSWDPTDVP